MSFYYNYIIEKRECGTQEDAFFYDGLCKACGIGTELDKNEAISLYQKGSSAGSAKCKYGLAVFSLKNEPDVALNFFMEAFPKLLREANEDDSFSQRMVSCYYYFGNRGVEKNLDEAIFWLEKAAGQNNPEAIFDLATCYEHGEGVEQDLKKAITLYRQSFVFGYTKAGKKLETLGLINGNA